MMPRLILWTATAGSLLCATGVMAQEAAQNVTQAPTVMAGDSTVPATAPAPASRDWDYSLGMSFKTSDLVHPSADASLRPIIGLHYGRWRIGQSTGDEWLRFSGYREDTKLEYNWLSNERLRVAFSGRIQNLKDNAGFDGFASGKNTLRGRVSLSYRLPNRWSIGADFTQDLLNRGDGTTASVGASYAWLLNDHSSLSVNSGVTWATADHWATQYRNSPPPAQAWRAGPGSLAGGLGYRYSIQPQWAWFATLGTSRALSQVAEVSPSNLTWSGQIGLLYFSR